MRVALVCGALALVLAHAASATIYPGVGIGKVTLGMTRAQVERALGKDSLVNSRAIIGGTQYVELAWDFASWTVAFARTGSVLSAVQVGTTLRTQRTAAHVGTGTLWRALVRAHPHGAHSGTHSTCPRAAQAASARWASISNTSSRTRVGRRRSSFSRTSYPKGTGR
jgi:hypothetical protein